MPARTHVRPGCFTWPSWPSGGQVALLFGCPYSQGKGPAEAPFQPALISFAPLARPTEQVTLALVAAEQDYRAQGSRRRLGPAIRAALSICPPRRPVALFPFFLDHPNTFTVVADAESDIENFTMRESAGTLLYRGPVDKLEVLLIHPSGNYNRRAP